MQENISLASFSSRLASQIWSEMQSDFLQNFIICNTTQHFIRPSKVPIILVQKPSISLVKPNFYSGFVSSPWLIRALLDHISNKVSTLEPMITGLQEELFKSIGLLPFDGGVTGFMGFIKKQPSWGSSIAIFDHHWPHATSPSYSPHH